MALGLLLYVRLLDSEIKPLDLVSADYFVYWFDFGFQASRWLTLIIRTTGGWCTRLAPPAEPKTADVKGKPSTYHTTAWGCTGQDKRPSSVPPGGHSAPAADSAAVETPSTPLLPPVNALEQQEPKARCANVRMIAVLFLVAVCGTSHRGRTVVCGIARTRASRRPERARYSTVHRWGLTKFATIKNSSTRGVR